MKDRPITVMIVDDEKLAIEDLSTLVDWGALGFEIVATAFNGSQALAKFEQYRPQVVFTDIKMPFMDGIELIHRIRMVDQEVALLLLTAYEDFSYARSAIQHGITDYIIKSEINAASLTITLIKLREAIQRRNQFHGMLIDKTIEGFFASSQPAAPPEDEEFLNGAAAFLIVEQDEPLMLNGEQIASFCRAPGDSILQVLRSIHYPQMSLTAVCSLPERRFLIALAPERRDSARLFALSYQCALLVEKELKEALPYRFSLYMTAQCVTYVELKALFRKHPEIFAQKYFEPAQKPLVLQQLIPAQGISKQPDSTALTECLAAGDLSGIEAALDKIYCVLKTNGRLRQLRMVSQDIYYILYHSAKSMGGGALDALQLNAEDNWTYWLDAVSICGWLKEKVAKLLHIRSQTENSHYSRMVIDAMGYIHRNFSKADLSLNEIANQLHISVGYLCMLFKQEKGVTLKNYITDVRIEEAKRLLERDYMKIYEICAAVGYHSSQYFSQVFFKKVGMYPAEYRKRVKSKI